MTQPHRIDRRRYPLGSNGADQIQLTCQGCRQPFDVGVERVKSRAFQPFCHTCWTEHLDLTTSIRDLGATA